MILSSLAFEVMDKEPSIVEWFLASLVLGLVGVLTCRRFPRALFILFPIYLFLEHLTKPHVRPVNESDPSLR
jgi:hypothetical protein